MVNKQKVKWKPLDRANTPEDRVEEATMGCKQWLLRKRLGLLLL